MAGHQGTRFALLQPNLVYFSVYSMHLWHKIKDVSCCGCMCWRDKGQHVLVATKANATLKNAIYSWTAGVGNASYMNEMKHAQSAQWCAMVVHY